MNEDNLIKFHMVSMIRKKKSMTKIDVVRVKQYSSKYTNIILINDIPVCSVRGRKSTSSIIAYIQGYDVELNDEKLKKQLEKVCQEYSS